MNQKRIFTAEHNYLDIDNYFREKNAKKIFLVCGKSIALLNINSYFGTLEERTGIRVVRFSNFQPNPSYESVVEGVEIFRAEECDIIVAVGGGSAMDVAKCIKLYCNMDDTRNYLEQEIIPNNIPLMVVPTTAGTGSEATRFAVIYYRGEKQSVSDYSCIPEAVLMDATVLDSLPEYQRKVTMLDALGHAMESLWSINSTEESEDCARKAIQLIMGYKDSYLQNEEIGNAKMLEASNFAGQAINITQTTAGHAMSYKLTSLYGIAHGHAVALCIEKLWPYMVANAGKCIDPRGKEHLEQAFAKIAYSMGCQNVQDAIRQYGVFLKTLSLEKPKANEVDFDILKQSVNPVRLKNNPVILDITTIETLYRQILSIK